MNLKKSALCIAVSLSLVVSPYAQARGISKNIDSYVDKYSNSVYAYTLRAEDLENALSENGLNGAYDAQIRKAIEKSKPAQGSLEQIKELELKEQMDLEAFQIVDQMFKQKNIEQMNLELLSIMHDYLFDSSARGPLSHILNAIEQYNFSPEQMREMKKKSMPLKQYTTGSMWGIAAISIGALFSLRKRGLHFAEAIGKKIEKTNVTATQPLSQKSTSTIVENKNEVEQMLLEIHILKGGTSESFLTRNTPQIISTSTQASKNKFFIKLSDFSKKQTFRNFVFVTGASVVGGSANVGYNALNQMFFDEDISNAYINPDDIKPKLYDGLAVLNLTCQSYDLLTRSKAIDFSKIEKTEITPEQFSLIKNLNSLYSEFTILKRLSPQYLEKSFLPSEVTANTAEGSVTLNANIKGKAISETIPCEMLKNAELDGNSRVSVNLGEVLLLLTESYLEISGQSL